MATPKFNSKSPTIRRILKEASELSSNPSPDYHAHPASDADLFDWHFTLRGPPSTPYSTGIYHGRIVLPPSYPLRPPSFRFLTPSGRFEVNREICLSISGHHEETWQPAWGIRTALVALRAFMEGEAKGQVGGLETTPRERERLAGLSANWRCGGCMEGKTNKEILEECERLCEESGTQKIKEEVPEELKMVYKDELTASSSGNATPSIAPVEQESAEEAELAEGFVRTGNNGSNDAEPEYPAARPAQSVSRPTPTAQAPQQNQRAVVGTVPPGTTAPARIAHAYPQQQQMQRISNDGVPVWIDRSIAVVVFCLAVMILKIMLGL